jgi:hypothetical protein
LGTVHKAMELLLASGFTKALATIGFPGAGATVLLVVRVALCDGVPLGRVGATVMPDDIVVVVAAVETAGRGEHSPLY